MVIEQMVEGEAEHLTRILLELAEKKNIQALRLCFERLLPVRKERAVNFSMRPIHSAEDNLVAFQEVAAAMAEGQMTPAEAQTIVSVLMARIKIAEHVDHERRLQQLEAQESKLEEFNKRIDQFASQFTPGSIG